MNVPSFKAIFSTIVKELNSESYDSFLVKPKYPQKPSQWLNPQPTTHRQYRAAMVNGAHLLSKEYVRNGYLNERQGAAIADLAKDKKEELAIEKCKENPGRHTFRTLGDIYQMVRLKGGVYSCVNTKEYTLDGSGLNWVSNKDKTIGFYGKPIRTGDIFQPTKFSEFRTIANHLREHRPIALDMMEMEEIRDKESSAEYTAHALARIKLNGRFLTTFDRNKAERALFKRPFGNFLIRRSSVEGCLYVSWVADHGGIQHDLFDAETGAARSEDGAKIDHGSKTIFEFMDELDTARKASSPSLGAARTRTGDEPAQAQNARPLASQPPPRPARPTGNAAQAPTNQRNAGPREPQQVGAGTRDAARNPKSPGGTENNVQPMGSIYGSSVTRAGQTSHGFLTEEAAREMIASAPANRAVRYQKENGDVYVFIKGEKRTTGPMMMNMRFLPDTEEVMTRNGARMGLQSFAETHLTITESIALQT